MLQSGHRCISSSLCSGLGVKQGVKMKISVCVCRFWTEVDCGRRMVKDVWRFLLY